MKGDINNWLIFTNDGYWDGSLDCGSLVAMVQGMEVWNIDQFAVRNNRPDIIAERLGAEPEIIAEFKTAYLRRLRRLRLTESDLTSDYRVPYAAILSAQQDSARNGKFVDLSLHFKSNGKPLTHYQVYINDVPLLGSLGKVIEGNDIQARERVELTLGENKIEVSCMDSGGAESFRANQSFFWSGDVKPDLYFLAFGVSDYADNPAIRDLAYAAKDARDLEAVFKKMAGGAYGKVFSRVLTDSQATKANILSAKSFLANARPDDTFILFISGHGVQVDQWGGILGEDERETSIGKRNERPEYTYYYVPSDARYAQIRETAVDFEAIESILQGIAPRQKLFLMDTCQSGEADETGAQTGGTGKNIHARTLSFGFSRAISAKKRAVVQALTQQDRWIYNDLVRRSGTIVFSGSKGGEYSYESDGEVSWKQGAFTQKIIEALKTNAADTNNDRIVSMGELEAYVSAEVPKLVKTLNPYYEQHPTVDRDNVYIKFGFPIVK
jgi:uncharacterized caspase-like protein